MIDFSIQTAWQNSWGTARTLFDQCNCFHQPKTKNWNLDEIISNKNYFWFREAFRTKTFKKSMLKQGNLSFFLSNIHLLEDLVHLGEQPKTKFLKIFKRRKFDFWAKFWWKSLILVWKFCSPKFSSTFLCPRMLQTPLRYLVDEKNNYLTHLDISSGKWFLDEIVSFWREINLTENRCWTLQIIFEPWNFMSRCKTSSRSRTPLLSVSKAANAARMPEENFRRNRQKLCLNKILKNHENWYGFDDFE